MTQPAGPTPRAFIRLVLALSSVAMVVFGALTLAGVIGLPPFLGYLFLAVAAIDLIVGFVVFKD